jgi:hypothetical protein
VGDIPEWSTNEIYHISLEVKSSIPSSFKLGQNYPNPFNGSTVIPFEVDESMEISIVIYDITGKLVDNVFSGYLEPGYHSFTWDSFDIHGNSVPSGFYIYQIRGGEVTLENKMILMK